MKKIIILFTISISTFSFSFSQNKQMEWHNGSIDTAMAKAEKLDAILFIYVYPENSSLTKEVNELFFTPRLKGSWASSQDVVDLYNNNMISVKMTAQAARRELGNTYDLSKPIFLWMNSQNKKPIKGEIISYNTLETLDLENTSKEVLLNEFEKTGKSHPVYEFENLKNTMNKTNCDDIFCKYEILHRIFLKMPESQKSLMYDEISNNPGELGSVEFKWLIEEEDFLNGKNEDRMKVFENALRYTYYKNTPNIKNLTYDELDEGYSKYANDNIIKPLGNYANVFKQHLIKKEVGKGFKNTETSLLKNAKFKFIDNEYGWSLNDVEEKIEYNFKHANSDDTISLIQLIFGENVEDLKESNVTQSNYILKDFKGSKITEQGSHEINGYYGYKTLIDFRESKISNIELVYQFKFTSKTYNYSFAAYAKKYDQASINRIEKFFYQLELFEKLKLQNTDITHEDKKGPTPSNNGKTFKTIKYNNGKISAEGNIDNKTGEKIGFWSNYNKKGRLVYTTIYTDNRNYTRSFYYPDGKPNNVKIFKNNMLWRIIESYNKDGKRTLIDGNGVYTTYYLNPMQLQFTSQMKNGVRDGVTNWYYKNGQLKQSVIYKYSEDENYTGLRWEVLMIFDKEGNPLDQGTLKNGNGTWKQYDNEVKLSGTSTYKNGIEVDWYSSK